MVFASSWLKLHPLRSQWLIRPFRKENSIGGRRCFPGYLRGVKGKRAPSGIVKYRDPVSGSGWSGRGRRPGWVGELEAQGKSIEDCRVA